MRAYALRQGNALARPVFVKETAAAVAMAITGRPDAVSLGAEYFQAGFQIVQVDVTEVWATDPLKAADQWEEWYFRQKESIERLQNERNALEKELDQVKSERDHAMKRVLAYDKVRDTYNADIKQMSDELSASREAAGTTRVSLNEALGMLAAVLQDGLVTAASLAEIKRFTDRFKE